MRKKKTKTLDYPKLFDAQTVTRDELLEQLRYWKTGDYGLTKYICSLIMQIAELRGFHPFVYNEVFGSCNVDQFSSRVCIKGTHSCEVKHEEDSVLDSSEDAVCD